MIDPNLKSIDILDLEGGEDGAEELVEEAAGEAVEEVDGEAVEEVNWEGDEENFELYTATLKNKTATVTATTTTKTWPDGIPVLKYLARGKSASTQINIGGSFDVAHDVAHGWFYFTDGRKWFALHREDGYNEPSDLPFEMAIKESAITEGFEVHYSDGIRAFKKFNKEKQALAFARDLI